MKKILITFSILISFLTFHAKAQETVPYSLKLFLENYGYFIDDYIEPEKLDNSIFINQGSSFFLNTQDTLLWPDYFELEDNYYKHRLGLKEFYDVFNLFRKYESDEYKYNNRGLGSIEFVSSKSLKYFDKYRVNVTEEHVFQNTDFYGSDSIARFSNYYDIISWFNPNSEKYEWRINKIYETQTKHWLSPKFWTAEVNYLFPNLNVDGVEIGQSFGVGIGGFANWVITGKGRSNYQLRSGIQFSSFSFNANKNALSQSTSELKDKDGSNFTLYSSLNNLDQKLSFQVISIPVHLKFSTYLNNKKQSVGIYGGVNFNFPVNESVQNNDGEISYMGKYMFDFYNDSILLQNLDNYGFRSFGFSELPAPEIEMNPFFLNVEAGVEFNWYLGKKWVASVSAGYLKSITPIFEMENQVLTYDMVENGQYGDFDPKINHFLTLNETSYLDAVKLGVSVSYLIDKPIIPHGKVGMKNSEIKKIVKSRLVTNSTSFTTKSTQKTVVLSVEDSRGGLGSSKVKYRYIGPTSKYYQSGKLNDGSKKGNKLNLQVPESNTGTMLFLEEPYGYELELDKDLNASEGGLYGEIKKIEAANIWQGSNDQRNISVGFKKLPELNLLLISYRYGFDDNGIIRRNTVDLIKRNIQNCRETGKELIVYVVSDKPQAWFITENDGIEKICNEIEIKLQNTDAASSNIDGLKNFFQEESFNARRKIKLDLIIAEEFIDFGKKMCENIAKTLSIDDNQIGYNTMLHSYGRMKSLDYEESYQYLEKKGKIK